MTDITHSIDIGNHSLILHLGSSSGILEIGSKAKNENLKGGHQDVRKKK